MCAVLCGAAASTSPSTEFFAMANVTAGSLISLTARLGEDAAICLKPESSEELVKKAHIARTVSKTAQRRIRSSVISFFIIPVTA